MKNHQWQKEENSTSLCYQPEPCSNPSKIIEFGTSELMNIGGGSVGLSKLAKIESEQWMIELEGNKFLILVPYLTTKSNIKALI